MKWATLADLFRKVTDIQNKSETTLKRPERTGYYCLPQIDISLHGARNQKLKY